MLILRLSSFRTALVASLAALALSACGGGGKSKSSGTTGTGSDDGSGGAAGSDSGTSDDSGTTNGGGGEKAMSDSSGGSGGSSGKTSTGSSSTGSSNTARCDSGDTVTLGDTVYDEAPSQDDPEVCDPQVIAFYYEDLVALGPGYNLALHYDWDAAGKAFDSFVTMNVYGTDVGDYELGLGNGQADLSWYISGDLCTASSGMLTLTSVGDIGGVLKGTLKVDGFSGPASVCPDTLEGSFTMTIVDSASL